MNGRRILQLSAVLAAVGLVAARHASAVVPLAGRSPRVSAVTSRVRPIAAYWDAVEAARSIADARSIPRPANGAAGRDGDLAEGLLKLREYELTFDRTAALVATRTLERVVDRTPNDAWAHYALGTALARGPDVRQRAYAERTVYSVFSLGTLAALHAPKELHEALRLDPTFTLAAIELGQLALDFSDPAMMREAVALLADPHMPSTGGSLIMQAEMQRRLGANATASTLTEKAVDAGYDESIAAYRRAESLFAPSMTVRMAGAKPKAANAKSAKSDTAQSSVAKPLGKPAKPSIEEAATAYFDGATMLTDAGSDLYYSSIELLMSESEAEQWRTLSPAQRGPWLRHFWDVRAALSGVTVPERLAEHFRRLAEMEPYRSAKTSAAPTAQSMKAASHPTLANYSPEVLALVKYGSVIRPQMYMYCKPGWDTLPIPMQPSLQACMNSSYGHSRQLKSHGECPPLPTDIWISPGMLDGWIACRGSGIPDQWDFAEVAGNRYAAGKRAVRGEAFYPSYDTPIAMTWEALQFHSAGRGAEVVSAVGVAHESMPAFISVSGFFNATISMTLTDTVSDWIVRAEAPMRAPAFDVVDGSYVLLSTSTPAPAAHGVALRIRVENADGTAGAIAYGNVDVERFDDDSLTMSDIVLSPSDGFGTFARGDVRLTLAPGRAFRNTETPTVYYEVYGATPNAHLTTEIRIDPVRTGVPLLLDKVMGTDHAITISFDEATTTPLPHFGVQLSRALDLRKLAPGNYQLTISVTDATTGRTTTRGRLLVIAP